MTNRVGFIGESAEDSSKTEKVLKKATRLGKTPWGCRSIPNGWSPQFFSALDLSLPHIATASSEADVERRRAARRETVMHTRSGRRSSSRDCVASLSKIDNNATCQNNRRTTMALLHARGDAGDGSTIRNVVDKAYVAIEKSDTRLTNRDTTDETDEEESHRTNDGNSDTTHEREIIATRERDYTPLTNLSDSRVTFINYYYWYQYNTNQPTTRQVVVSPVIPSPSSQGVAA